MRDKIFYPSFMGHLVGMLFFIMIISEKLCIFAVNICLNEFDYGNKDH